VYLYNVRVLVLFAKSPGQPVKKNLWHWMFKRCNIKAGADAIASLGML
jgi:hypothetical protein